MGSSQPYCSFKDVEHVAELELDMDWVEMHSLLSFHTLCFWSYQKCTHLLQLFSDSVYTVVNVLSRSWHVTVEKLLVSRDKAVRRQNSDVRPRIFNVCMGENVITRPILRHVCVPQTTQELHVQFMVIPYSVLNLLLSTITLK